jgi:hypothetical protein
MRGLSEVEKLTGRESRESGVWSHEEPQRHSDTGMHGENLPQRRKGGKGH